MQNGKDLLTPYGMQVEEDLCDDDAHVDEDEDTEDDLKRVAIQDLEKLLTTSERNKRLELETA